MHVPGTVEDADRTLGGFCLGRADGTHCNCWWNMEGPCCGCGFEGGDEEIEEPR